MAASTQEEAKDYVKYCVDRLAVDALEDNDLGATVRSELGHQLRSLVTFGLIDSIEAAVRGVCDVRAKWPEAIVSLGNLLRFDTKCMTPDTIDRVRSLMKDLEPKSLSARIRALVSEMPFDHQTAKTLNTKSSRTDNVLRSVLSLTRH